MLSLPPHRHVFPTTSTTALLSPYSHHLQPVEYSTRNPSTFLGLIKCNEGSHNKYVPKSYKSTSFRGAEESSEDASSSDRFVTFEEAVKLFNERDYYACHDLLESLWFQSNDPLRTLIHALLQCAVAFYHLFNHNHKGAMMEMGEGLCKLRKLNIEEGPLYQFEQEISIVLNFIYQTQLELAACSEDFCLTMEQTERSYQLLEGFGAGERLYILESKIDSQERDITYIVFDPQTSYGATNLPCTRVKLPILEATWNHLIACEEF